MIRLSEFAFFRKRAAAAAGVFFEDTKFWPPYYTWAGCTMYGVSKVLHDVYDAKRGGVVDLLVTPDGRIHRCKLLGMSFAGGSDHIVSPRQFHLQFWDTKTTGAKP